MAPTFLIVVGAWHKKECGSLLVDELRRAGYSSHSVDLPTVGTTKPLADDNTYLRECITGLLHEGKDLVVVLHSYAGFPGSAAVKGLGKAARQGEPGGSILGIVFLSAFIPNENQSLEEMVGGTLPAWQALDEEKGLTSVPDPKAIFYPDVPDDLAVQAISSLQLHSLKSFRDPAGPAGFKDNAYDGRRVYILTSEDPCFPIAWQEGGVAGSGVDWERVTMATSHSPFLSKPKELSEHLVSFAQRWS